MAAHDFAGDREPETATRPNLLGGKKRFENAVQVPGRDPLAGVPHFDKDFIAHGPGPQSDLIVFGVAFGDGMGSSAFMDLAWAQNGDLFACGDFSGTAGFGAGDDLTATAQADQSMFVVRYDMVDGEALSAVTAGTGLGACQGASLAAIGDEVVVGGFCNTTADLGSGMAHVSLGDDPFVVRYGNDLSFQWELFGSGAVPLRTRAFATIGLGLIGSRAENADLRRAIAAYEDG